MEETIFKIEYQDLVKVWLISRLYRPSGAWIPKDTRMFRQSAVRRCRKLAGKDAQLVLTKTDSAGTMELTYRRFK